MNNKLLVIGAIATPVLLSMVWGLNRLWDHRLELEEDPLSHNERGTLTDQQGESPLRDLGIIATGAAGLFVLLNRRFASRDAERADLSGADLNCADFKDTNLSKADLSGANLRCANLSGANLRYANLSGANLTGADLSGADLSNTEFRYANLSGANLRYANLSDADLRYANLSDAHLNCALVGGANFSDANLSGALLFFLNLREVQNLEPLQLEAKPSPFLCHVALPRYSQQPDLDPNRDCHLIPQLLSAPQRGSLRDPDDISLKEAQEIINEARRHKWD
ncbi:pentapeptide repeat-containing protein [Cyanothece sp. BG0011]|uniref:pentapeptide repeat-containing protein n=1 Tax=Cyanothece sp. BG0011 TaxID=2082950 RepID=UPI000D1F0811|nr:pentapeptide repeat-containing protein [Cyanothece sp. BG0011]